MAGRSLELGGAELLVLCRNTLLLDADDSPVPLLATTRIHIEAAVARSVGSRYHSPIS